MKEEKYYILLYTGKYQTPEIYKYIKKTVFNIDDAILHKERWQSKHKNRLTGDPIEAIIVKEVKYD